MEITIDSTILYITILLTGLSAGLFYAWQVSVIPGTRLVQDSTYIESMQQMNREIINPFFMLIFLGSLVMQILSIYVHWDTTRVLWWILGATILYGAGTILVTGMGNVPLNNALDTLNPDELSPDQISAERSDYESRWNKLHTIRTIFSVLSFMMLLIAAFIHASPES